MRFSWLYVISILAILLLVSSVSAANPVAAFSGTPLSGGNPLNTAFTDASTGSPTAWAWFFGDESYGGTWVRQVEHASWSDRSDACVVTLHDGSVVIAAGYTGGSPYLHDVWRSTDKGVTWTQQTAAAEFPVNENPACVVTNDDTILLIGGYTTANGYDNRTWSSTDKGVHWSLQNATTPGWAGRYGQAVAHMADDSLLLYGGGKGASPYYTNDTWRSADKGVTWTLQNASSGWGRRYYTANGIALSDGSALVIGGGGTNDGGTCNAYGNSCTDVWRTTDNGVTWTQQSATGTGIRIGGSAAVVMPDDTILVMGGYDYTAGELNGVWMSRDKGVTWTLAKTAAEWSVRSRVFQMATVLTDGSILIMGASDSTRRNDVWRLNPTGSTSQNPSHSFTSIAAYTVGLIASHSTGFDWETKQNYVNVLSVVTPVASFTPNSTAGISPMPVLFTDSSTNTPTSWYWVFGDGNTSTLQNPTNIYYGDGHYYANLTATNSAGSNTSATQLIHVGLVPEADFTKTHTIGAIPLTVQFTDTSLHNPTSWLWNYADGLTDNNTQQNPMHTYLTPGVYGVTLTATNFHGNNISAIQDVTVGYAPISNFIPNATLGGLPFAVHFTDNSTLFPTSWYWDFKDGNTSILQNPDNVFSAAGDYWVTLNATNAYGSNVSTQKITAGFVPTSSFTKNHATGNPPLTVTYTFTGTGAVSYLWNFDDGDSTNATAQNPVHTFASSGAYHVYCNATNTYGTTKSLEQVVVVGLVPSAAWTHNTTGTDPQYVQFTSTGTDSAWVQQSATAGWAGRRDFALVKLNDDSMVLMGGSTPTRQYDVWRSYDKGVTWSLVTANGGFDARDRAAAVAFANNTIIIMGGWDGVSESDVWISTNNGTSFTKTIENAGYGDRAGHKAVLLPDNSIVLMGGVDGSTLYHDVWRSTDMGATWVQQTAAAGWSARRDFAAVATSNGDIIVAGGFTTGYQRDVWKSVDKGVTWTQMTASALWTGRLYHSMVVMPDDVLILSGGYATGAAVNDTYYSKDYGATWSLYPIAGTWAARMSHRSIAFSDGSVVLVGGYTGSSYMNGAWKLIANGALTYLWVDDFYGYVPWTSTLKSPVEPLIYSSNAINLTVTNIFGSYTSSIVNIPISFTPAFTGTPLVGVEPLTVCFTDAATGNPDSYLWTFGDLGAGNTSTLQNPCHTYAYGTFSVTQQINHASPGIASTIQKVNYVVVTQDYPRVTGYTATPASGTTSAPPSFAPVFTAVYTGGIPTSYKWYINGTYYTTDHPTHTFTTNGVYPVNCTLSNVMGSTFFNSTYTVNGLPPFVTVYAPVQPTGQYAPATAQAMVGTNGTPPFTYLWTVNGVPVSTTYNMTHLFPLGGTYLVNATITNAWGHAHLNLTYVVLTMPVQGVSNIYWSDEAGNPITSAYTGKNVTFVFNTVSNGTNPPLGAYNNRWTLKFYKQDISTGNWLFQNVNETFYTKQGISTGAFFWGYTGSGLPFNGFNWVGYGAVRSYSTPQNVQVRLMAWNTTVPGSEIQLGIANLTVTGNPLLISNVGAVATSTGGTPLNLVLAAIIVIIFIAVPFVITRVFNLYIEIFAAILAIGLSYFAGLIDIWVIIGMGVIAGIIIFFMNWKGGGGSGEASEGGEIG